MSIIVLIFVVMFVAFFIYIKQKIENERKEARFEGLTREMERRRQDYMASAEYKNKQDAIEANRLRIREARIPMVFARILEDTPSQFVVEGFEVLSVSTDVAMENRACAGLFGYLSRYSYSEEDGVQRVHVSKKDMFFDVESEFLLERPPYGFEGRYSHGVLIDTTEAYKRRQRDYYKQEASRYIGGIPASWGVPGVRFIAEADVVDEFLRMHRAYEKLSNAHVQGDGRDVTAHTKMEVDPSVLRDAYIESLIEEAARPDEKVSSSIVGRVCDTRQGR